MLQDWNLEQVDTFGDAAAVSEKHTCDKNRLVGIVGHRLTGPHKAKVSAA